MTKEQLDIAEKLGSQMKSVSVAEFFKKNKHLLGFDSPIKSMLMVVKEAIDNSLDATEEYGHTYYKKNKKWYFPKISVDIKKEEYGLVILPKDSNSPLADIVKTGKKWELMHFGRKLRASKIENNKKIYNVDGIKVHIVEEGLKKPKVYIENERADIKEITLKYKITIIDNGPGIIEKNIPNVFGKLLYGSKFHRLRQSRGQQGIGISSVVLYAQQTTGMPAKIISKTEHGKAVKMNIMISDNNEPIVSDKEYVDFPLEHGTEISVIVEAEYTASGEKSVYEFLRRTSLVNPHATIIFSDPNKKKYVFKRTSNALPPEPKEIKPHPHGLEFGKLRDMLSITKAKTIKSFLVHDLSKVSANIAESVLDRLNIKSNSKPSELTRKEIEKLLRALQKAKINRPSTDCLSPIGEKALRKSIMADTKAEFIAVVSRKPTVYKGIPFLIEAAIAYGGEIKNSGIAQRLRFANKIPLSYDAAGCAITKAIKEVSWKNYKIENVAQNGLPSGPYIILVHIASVWVPYTSEGKSAIASYPDIIKEMKLAIQDCGRKLKMYLSAKYREKRQLQRRSLFEIYIPELAYSLSKITNVNEKEIIDELKKIIKKQKIKGENEIDNKLNDSNEGDEQ